MSCLPTRIKNLAIGLVGVYYMKKELAGITGVRSITYLGGLFQAKRITSARSMEQRLNLAINLRRHTNILRRHTCPGGPFRARLYGSRRNQIANGFTFDLSM